MYCEAGKFLWKTSNVTVETDFTTPAREAADQGKSLWNKALSTAIDVGKWALAVTLSGK